MKSKFKAAFYFVLNELWYIFPVNTLYFQKEYIF